MRRPARVALVDDDASVRRALTRLLVCAGYEVEAFASADAFLRGSFDALDCAFVDVRMTGETGLALAQFLQMAGVSMPVVLMTGDVDPTLAAKAARCGAFALLSKPLSAEVMIEAIETAIAGRHRALTPRP